MKNPALLLWIQSLYYFLTGVWPLVHINSFIWVTGPKTDIWLVKTFGGLVAAVGLTLLVAAKRKETSFSIFTLGAGSAFALLFADTYYATNDTILDVYLLDAATEGVIILAWILFFIKGQLK